MEALLTRREARSVLRCASDVVSKAISTGMLPVIRFGRSCKIQPSALEKFINSMEGKDLKEEVYREVRRQNGEVV